MGDEIAVLVIEGNDHFRRGLVACLGSDPKLRVVGIADTAAQGYGVARQHLPNVVVLGSPLPDTASLTAVVALRLLLPESGTIVVADPRDSQELNATIRAGATAYVSRDVPEDHLLDLIHRVAGHPSGDASLRRQPKANRRLPRLRDGVSPLTKREMAVLRGIGAGMTNSKIAFALGISPQTVRTHVASILRKLAVHDRTQAAVLAVRHGWLGTEVSVSSAGSVSEVTTGEKLPTA